jgi:hypothetical protein
MRSLSRSEIPFLSILGLVFALAALGLALDLTEEVESGKEAMIGTIVFRLRRAERKFTDQVLWDSLQENSPVFNRDTIRTAADSAATVYLDDGTRIDMDEETMLLVDIGKEETRLDLSGGTVAVSRSSAKAAAAKAAGPARPARPAPSAGGSTEVEDLTRPELPGAAFSAGEITIVTSQGRIVVEDGELALRDDGERLSVAVNDGSARLSTAAGASVLQEAQAATIEQAGTIAQTVSLAPVAPAQGAELYCVSDGYPVEFEWIGPAGFSGSLIVSSDPLFESIVGSEPVAGTKATLTLTPGSYYWRVEGRDQNTRARRVTVNRLVRPELADPRTRIIGYRGAKPPLVDLAWLPAYPKTGYFVELSSSKDFSSVHLSIRTNSTTISVNAPSDGQWFWRVRALYPSLGVETSTDIGVFLVERRAAEAPVIRGESAEPIKASGLSMLEGGTVISWNHVEGADAYIVKVALDEAIRNVVLQRRSTTSSITLSGELSPGLYYVTVSAEEADRVSPPSAPRALVVANPEPIGLVAPSRGAVLPAGASTVDASWRDPNGLGRYRVEFAPDEAFTAVIAKTDAVGTRCAAELPRGATGSLYWRVARVNDKGDRVLISPVSSLWRPRLMEEPAQLGPRDGAAIDVFYQAGIDFEWRAVPGASHYLVRLNRMLSGNPVSLREWKVTAAALSLKDLSMLAEGNFAWDVTAFDERDGLVHGSSGTSRAYFRIVQSRPVEAPVIELPRIIFVK